ncbi:SGNH/GDSL hydrolase family protein [Burkholderia lata]|uniref:SGNH/GDSL hydrolase family protein n=1 Tax=Burkholderia lata (strain ATCC 17760 / DSM 23089 / LMG 22485 / NCIMB 9086 / R18194 / 383) TaxID=482957 RepID=UPI001454A173|nr:SGNH/GDSL hydrolase family protein [Burkholderia lata]VWB98625.1 GDSL family lipase [Burkholderia lata]
MRGGQSLASGSRAPYLDSAPGELQLLAQARYGNVVTVSNDGVPGASIHDALNGLPPFYTETLQKRIASDVSKVVIENFAINDAVRSNPEQFRQDLMTWVDVVRASGKIAVLEEPNPICSDDAEKVRQLTVVVDQVAIEKDVPLVQQYAYIESLEGWKSLLLDCVHPNDVLYRIKADREFSALSPIINSLL